MKTFFRHPVFHAVKAGIALVLAFLSFYILIDGSHNTISFISFLCALVASLFWLGRYLWHFGCLIGTICVCSATATMSLIYHYYQTYRPASDWGYPSDDYLTAAIFLFVAVLLLFIECLPNMPHTTLLTYLQNRPRKPRRKATSATATLQAVSELKALLDAGILSTEEFAARKAILFAPTTPEPVMCDASVQQKRFPLFAKILTTCFLLLCIVLSVFACPIATERGKKASYQKLQSYLSYVEQSDLYVLNRLFEILPHDYRDVGTLYNQYRIIETEIFIYGTSEPVQQRILKNQDRLKGWTFDAMDEDLKPSFFYNTSWKTADNAYTLSFDADSYETNLPCNYEEEEGSHKSLGFSQNNGIPLYLQGPGYSYDYFCYAIRDLWLDHATNTYCIRVHCEADNLDYTFYYNSQT